VYSPTSVATAKEFLRVGRSGPAAASADGWGLKSNSRRVDNISTGLGKLRRRVSSGQAEEAVISLACTGGTGKRHADL